MAQREAERHPAWRRLVALGAAALLLGGCSWLPNALNPIEWYRDVTGASSHDDETGSERNKQNLEAGGKQPYPNLGSVPKPPDTALSTAERERLQKGLVADRANARYSDEELRQGRTVPPLPGEAPAAARAAAASGTAPEAPAAGAAPNAPSGGATASGEGSPPGSGGTPRRTPPTRGSATAPQESSLVSPQVRGTPEGEASHAPPPAPPGVPQGSQSTSRQPSGGRQTALVLPPSPPAAAPSQPAVMRAPSTGRRPNVVLQAAEIMFPGGSTKLGEQDNRNLADVAKLTQNADAHLRVIGYMRSASAADAADRELQAFNGALDRANAVAQALIKLGIAANRITVQAAPELASTGSDAARVEVFLEY
jgi:outer membrane protein OmpA-like peptidoglycan-associated protein